MTAFKNKSAAHTVNGSTGGRWEQVFKGLVSAVSLPETGRLVKSRREFDGGRRRSPSQIGAAARPNWTSGKGVSK